MEFLAKVEENRTTLQIKGGQLAIALGSTVGSTVGNAVASTVCSTVASTMGSTVHYSSVRCWPAADSLAAAAAAAAAGTLTSLVGPCLLLAAALSCNFQSWLTSGG